MFGEKIRNNIAVAIDTLRANKLRSALTILGVVMGVSTVMAMAAIVQGIKEQIVRTIEIAGPTTFYVIKAFSQTPVNPDRLPVWIRIRPDLSPEDLGPGPRTSRVQGSAHSESAHHGRR
jgi:putative ABC transport system permease protein